MVLDASVLAALIQDPNITSSIIGGIVGGCVEPFVSHSIGWVSDRYKGHPKAAIINAQNNAINFLGQVNICLQGQQQIEGIESKTKDALSDPDYTILFQEAVLGAARTDSEQKHKILARLVTDRLSAEPDSLRNLAAHMACNAIPQLSNTHLKLLGLLYIIRNYPAPSYIMSLPYDNRIAIGTKWFLSEIASLIPSGEVTNFDFAQLAAVSCITYVPEVPLSLLSNIGEEPDCWKLPCVVFDKLITYEEQVHHGRIRWILEIGEDQIGESLLSIWTNSDMRKASLTPAGSLIGMHVVGAISHEH